MRREREMGGGWTKGEIDGKIMRDGGRKRMGKQVVHLCVFVCVREGKRLDMRTVRRNKEKVVLDNWLPKKANSATGSKKKWSE